LRKRQVCHALTANFWTQLCKGIVSDSFHEQVKDSDPIKQASLENVLRENLKACAALHGDAAFNAAISRIHPAAFAQLQQALNTAWDVHISYLILWHSYWSEHAKEHPLHREPPRYRVLGDQTQYDLQSLQ
jgi:hypothetical protein